MLPCWKPQRSKSASILRQAINQGLAAFVAGRTLLESAMIARGTTPLGPGFSALMDLAVWFHHPPDVSDWLLYEQHSPSGIGGRGLAQGTMFNRTGQLVCTMTLECYFGGKSSG